MGDNFGTPCILLSCGSRNFSKTTLNNRVLKLWILFYKNVNSSRMPHGAIFELISHLQPIYGVIFGGEVISVRSVTFFCYQQNVIIVLGMFSSSSGQCGRRWIGWIGESGRICGGRRLPRRRRVSHGDFCLLEQIRIIHSCIRITQSTGWYI